MLTMSSTSMSNANPGRLRFPLSTLFMTP
jgi:hypothetical protein